MKLHKGIIVELTPKFSTKHILELEVDNYFHNMIITNRKVLIDIDNSSAQYSYDLEEYHGIWYVNGVLCERESCFILKDISECELEQMVETVKEYKRKHDAIEHFRAYMDKSYRCDCFPKAKVSLDDDDNSGEENQEG